ncbi:hypothetical protein [Deinococcus sp. KNUC1210]|nr:hypothetical protein [Deinococcus sp. KNUC1210]
MIALAIAALLGAGFAIMHSARQHTEAMRQFDTLPDLSQEQE